MAEFFEGNLADLSECVAVENVCDGVVHIEHEEAQAAVFLIGAGAFGIGRVAHASDRRERAVDEPHDLAHGNILGRLGEEEAAVLTALAIDDAGFA